MMRRISSPSSSSLSSSLSSLSSFSSSKYSTSSNSNSNSNSNSKSNHHININENIKISRISIYKVDLPLHESSYKWGKGKQVTTFDSTIVKIDTNIGIYGYGEQCPLGSNYLPQFPEATREGIKVLSKVLIGKNPIHINNINNIMDTALKGHPYVKSAIDIALWDILGKITNMPVCELLGGRFESSSSSSSPIPLYRAISQGTASDMVTNVEKYISMGYRKFQLKVGANVTDDINRIRDVRKLLDRKAIELNPDSPVSMPLMCDANTGWTQAEAMQVVNGVKDLTHTYIEQPCLTYDECLSVRRHCPLPMILDECMDDIGVLCKIISDKSADMINLKISKVGGLTKARAIRDLAVSSRLHLNIEDTWGGDIVTAAITHLAQSTSPHFLFCSTDFNSYGPVSIADTSAKRKENTAVLSAPTSPGLGVEIYPHVIGKPLFIAE